MCALSSACDAAAKLQSGLEVGQAANLPGTGLQSADAGAGGHVRARADTGAGAAATRELRAGADAAAMAASSGGGRGNLRRDGLQSLPAFSFRASIFKLRTVQSLDINTNNHKQPSE